MLSISIAAVAATVLFLLFRSTRALGVIGVFVLVALAPVVFGTLLLLAGAVYLLFFRRHDYDLTPKAGALRHDAKRGRLLGSLVLATGAAGVLALTYSPATGDWVPPWNPAGARSTATQEVIVRTPGGRLEVSRLYTTEIIDTRVTHKLLGIRIGELVPRIRVPAVYTYTIELAKEWHVLKTGNVYTVLVPPIKPSLPVAVDFSGIERDISGSWILQPWKGSEDLRNLERGVTEELARKASSRDLLERQREEARRTVSEFARKWIAEQTPWTWLRPRDIRVLFADETVDVLGRPAG